MFALLEFPYVYPYGYIAGSLMIWVLVIGIGLFAKFFGARKYLLISLLAVGLAELFFPVYELSAEIGCFTLTCVAIMAAVHLIKTFRARLVAGLPFVILGGILMVQAYDALGTVVLSFQFPTHLTYWVLLISWSLTAMCSGVLMIVVSFRKRHSSLRMLSKANKQN